MNLKVGMYVRTRSGLGKIISISEYNAAIEFSKTNALVLPISKENIKKSSFNIIDLIEVGDYVNGKFVDNTSLGRGKYIFCGTKKVYEIESIVTKEQFESMGYKVGG